MELSHTFRIQNLILYNAHSTFDLQSNYRGEFLDKEQQSQGLVSASVLVSFRTIYTTTKSQDSLISIFLVADPSYSGDLDAQIYNKFDLASYIAVCVRLLQWLTN